MNCRLNIVQFSRGHQSHEFVKTTKMVLAEEKTAPSAASHEKVVSIEQHPENEKLLLVGFADGQIVLYDLEAEIIQQRFDHSGQELDGYLMIFDVGFRDDNVYSCVFSMDGDGLRRLAIKRRHLYKLV